MSGGKARGLGPVIWGPNSTAEVIASGGLVTPITVTKSSAETTAAVGTASQWNDLANVTLGAGTWLIYGGYGLTSAITQTRIFELFIGTVVGNDATGLVQQDNHVRRIGDLFNGAHESTSVKDYVVTITSSTTYYLKYKIDGSTSMSTEGYKLQAIRLTA